MKKKFKALLILASGVLIASCGKGGDNSSVPQSADSNTPSSIAPATSSSKGTPAESSTTITPIYDYDHATWTWTGNDTDGYTSATITIVCTNKAGEDKTQTVEATSERTEPTHTEKGKITYTVSVSIDGHPFTDHKEVEIPATGHTYKLSEFTWTGDDTNGYTAAKAIFKCTGNDDQKEVEATVTHETTDPTDTEAGKTVYTAKATFEGKEYTDTKTVTIPAIGHEYKLVGFNWTENDTGGYSAKATFKCVRDDDTKVVDATVTSDTTPATHTEKGKTTYTAKATFEGKEYSDKKEVEIPATGHNYEFKEWQWIGNDTDGYTGANAIFKCHDDESETTVKATIKKTRTVEPSCTEKGNDHYEVSAVLKEGDTPVTVTKDVEVAALGHDMEHLEDVEDKAATYYEEGRTGVKRCPRCKQIIEEGTAVAKKTVSEETTAEETSSDAGLALVSDSLIQNMDQTAKKFVRTKDKGNADADGLYFSHKDAWGEEAGYSEIGLDLDETDKYNQIAFDYRLIDFASDAKDSDNHHVLIETKDNKGVVTTKEADTLNKDGAWHTVTLDFDHASLAELHIKIYHFQGELVLSHVTVSTANQAKAALAKKYEGSHELTKIDSETLTLMKQAGYGRMYALFELKDEKSGNQFAYQAEDYNNWNVVENIDLVNGTFMHIDLGNYDETKDVGFAGSLRMPTVSKVVFTSSNPTKEEALKVLDTFYKGTNLIGHMPGEVVDLMKLGQVTKISGTDKSREHYPNDTINQYNFQISYNTGSWHNPEVWSTGELPFSVNISNVDKLTDVWFHYAQVQLKNGSIAQLSDVNMDGDKSLVSVADLHFE